MKLVCTEDYGIKGANHYWLRRDYYHISEDELRLAGVNNGKAYVDEVVIPRLQHANAKLAPRGYELIVKDAYRSPELYKVINDKRNAMFGKKQTDRLMNMVTKPHTTGKTVDVSLLDIATGQEVAMRNRTDDPDNFFIDFYKNKSDVESQEYQRLQELLIKTMLEVGFRLGVKKEFWHFELNAK